MSLPSDLGRIKKMDRILEEEDPDHVPCVHCEGQGEWMDYDTGDVQKCVFCAGTGWVITDE